MYQHLFHWQLTVDIFLCHDSSLFSCYLFSGIFHPCVCNILVLVLAFVQWYFVALCCTVNAEARRRIRLSIQRQWESWMHWSRRGWQWQWHPGHPHQILPTVSLTNWAFHHSLQTWWAWNLGLFSISCPVSADHVGYCWLWFKKRYYALRSWTL